MYLPFPFTLFYKFFLFSLIPIMTRLSQIYFHTLSMSNNAICKKCDVIMGPIYLETLSGQRVNLHCIKLLNDKWPHIYHVLYKFKTKSPGYMASLGATTPNEWSPHCYNKKWTLGQQEVSHLMIAIDVLVWAIYHYLSLKEIEHVWSKSFFKEVLRQL